MGLAGQIKSSIALVMSFYIYTVMEMLEKRTQDYEVQLTRTIDELQTTKEQLVKITAQEAALVQQNAKMSMELVAQENSQKKLKSEMKCVKEQLKSRETELGKMKEEAGKMKTKHQGTEESLEKELEEKNKTLKDYQEKVQGYYLTWNLRTRDTLGTIISLFQLVCPL